MGGMDAKDGAWPWQVDIQVGHIETVLVSALPVGT